MHEQLTNQEKRDILVYGFILTLIGTLLGFEAGILLFLPIVLIVFYT